MGHNASIHSRPAHSRSPYPALLRRLSRATRTRVRSPSRSVMYEMTVDSAQPGNKSGWPRGIDFIDGFNPGNNSLFARAGDPVAISLLQARLIELGAGLEIVPIEDYVW